MPRLNFILPNTQRKEVEAKSGETVMAAARANDVPGIEAECGGCLSCATCHAFIIGEWYDRLPPPSEDERMMLSGAVDERAESRLTCQIIVTDELDGIVIEVPASQY